MDLPFLYLAMLSSCLAICFFRLLHANHHGGLGGGNEDGFGEDLAIVHSQDDFNGDIVIEHRHRPLVHTKLPPTPVPLGRGSLAGHACQHPHGSKLDPRAHQ